MSASVNLCVSILHTTGVTRPLFALLILVIFSSSANDQEQWGNAWWIIAGMKNVASFWYLAFVNFVRYAMCSHQFRMSLSFHFNRNHPIVKLSRLTLPRPFHAAFFGGNCFFEETKKSFFKGEFLCGMGIKCSRSAAALVTWPTKPTSNYNRRVAIFAGHIPYPLLWIRYISHKIAMQEQEGGYSTA